LVFPACIVSHDILGEKSLLLSLNHIYLAALISILYLNDYLTQDEPGFQEYL